MIECDDNTLKIIGNSPILTHFPQATIKPISNAPRPVEIKFKVEGDKRGLFWGWIVKDSAESEYIGCKRLFGVIELPNGDVVPLMASDFRFIDSDVYFNQFCWESG